MATGLWGKKIGMTQLFSEDNVVIPVTAVNVSGWLVTNIRSKERDGYDALQLGLVKNKYRDNEFEESWLKKSRKYFSILREIKLSKPAGDKFVIGKAANICSLLKEGDAVDISGYSKGCGFAGVVKRYNFVGAPKSHGSTMGKRPGSLSFMRSRGRVMKGKKLPGHMGNAKCIIKNLAVIKIEPESKTLFIKGSIPGKSGSLIFIRREL